MLKSQKEKIRAINSKTMIVGIDIVKKTYWARVIDYIVLERIKPFSFHK